MGAISLDRIKAKLEILREEIVDYIQYDLGLSLENSQISIDEICQIIEKDKCRMLETMKPAIVKINITKHYKKLPSMIEKYRNIEMAMKTLEENKERPRFIKELIDKNFLYEDGYRCVKSLYDVADHLVGQWSMTKITAKYLHENFFNKNWEKYSKHTTKIILSKVLQNEKENI